MGTRGSCWDKRSGAPPVTCCRNPEENYVQIPTASTQFEDGKFTQADYEALVAAMFAGDVTVSNDITAMPAVTNVTVEDFGNLK